jgi:hypothetical protein
VIRVDLIGNLANGFWQSGAVFIGYNEEINGNDEHWKFKEYVLSGVICIFYIHVIIFPCISISE